MLNDGVIRKNEFNHKLKQVKINGHKIEQAILAKQDSIHQLEISLGIVKENLKDAKELKEFKNVPAARERWSPAKNVKLSALESKELLQEKEQTEQKNREARSLIRKLKNDK